MELSPKRERNAAGPVGMFREVATLVHPIESSKRAARAQGIRSVVLLEVPRPLEGRPCLVSAAINNLWRDKAFQAKKTADGFSIDLACVGESALPTGRRELSSVD